MRAPVDLVSAVVLACTALACLTAGPGMLVTIRRSWGRDGPPSGTGAVSVSVADVLMVASVGRWMQPPHVPPCTF